MLCCVHAFLSQSGPYFLGKDLSFVEINMMPFIARFVLLMPHFRNIDIFSKARIPSAQKNGWAKKRQRGQNSGIEEQTHADTDRQTDRHTHTDTHIHIHMPCFNNLSLCTPPLSPLIHRVVLQRLRRRTVRCSRAPRSRKRT